MRRRKELNDAKIAKKQAEIEDELVNLDIEQVVEQEKQADAAQDIMEQEKLDKETDQAAATGGAGAFANNSNIMASILNASNVVNGLLGDIKNNFMDIAIADELKRKTDSKKQINKINDDIDIALEKSKLLNQLAAVDGALAANIEED